MNGIVQKLDFQKYFDEMRLRIGIINAAKKEIDRFVAPDFNLFSILWPDEVRLSNIIAELVDPHGSHGQGNLFLFALLETLEISNPSFSSTKFKEAWAGDKNIKVRKEETTRLIEASQRRMDILISNKDYGLMIENKPWAYDQKDQLKDYRKELGKRFPGRHAMIYLSREGMVPSDESIDKKDREELIESGELMVIGFRPHVVSWLNRCHSLAEADRVCWIIKDFIAYIEAEFPVSTNNRMGGEKNGYV